MTLLPSSVIPPDPSPQLKDVLKFLEAAAKLDLAATEAFLTDDIFHTTLPKSVGTPKFVGKEGSLQYYKKIMSLFEFYNVEVEEIIDAPGKVVLHITAEGKYKHGLGGCKNEHILILSVKEQPDGLHKISGVKEFGDSKITSTFDSIYKSILGVLGL